MIGLRGLGLGGQSLRDDVHTPTEPAEPGLMARTGTRLRHIHWANALSGRWWWRQFNRRLIQTGRLTALLALIGLVFIRISDPEIVQFLRGDDPPAVLFAFFPEGGDLFHREHLARHLAGDRGYGGVIEQGDEAGAAYEMIQ